MGKKVIEGPVFEVPVRLDGKGAKQDAENIRKTIGTILSDTRDVEGLDAIKKKTIEEVKVLDELNAKIRELGDNDGVTRLTNQINAKLKVSDIKIKSYMQQISAIDTRLEELGKSKTATKGYSRLQDKESIIKSQIDRNKQQLEELRKNPVIDQIKEVQKIYNENHAAMYTMKDRYGKGLDVHTTAENALMDLKENNKTLWESYVKAENQTKALEDSLKSVQSTMKDMEGAGTAFISGKDTKEYEKLTAQRENLRVKGQLELAKYDEQALAGQEKVNALEQKQQEEIQKTNELIKEKENVIRKLGVEYNELGKKTENVTNKETGSAGAGIVGVGGTSKLSANMASISKGASKTLLSVGKIGKLLKSAFLTLTAVTLGVRGVMGLINKIRGMIKEGFAAIYEGDKKFKKQVDDLKKSWAEVKANLAAAFLPIVQMAIPYIQKLLDWINQLINKIAMFVAAIAGQKAYTKAIKATGDAAKGASKQLSKFDELNNLSSGSGGSDWSTQKLPIDEKMLALAEKFKAILAEIKDRFQDLVVNPFKEGFANALGDWDTKFAKFKNNVSGIGHSLIEIFSNPDLLAAQDEWLKSFSKMLGSLAGLATNAGLNIAIALTGGIDQFLKEHKGEITADLTEMFNVEGDILDNISQLAVDISRIFDVIGESESLQNTLANLLDTVYQLGSGMELFMLKVAELGTGVIAELVHNNVEKIKEALESLFVLLDKASLILDAVATSVKSTLLNLFDKVIVPIADVLRPILQELLDSFFMIWGQVQPILADMMDDLLALWKEYIDPLLNDVIELLSFLGPLVERVWNTAIKPTIDWLLTLLPIVIATVKLVFDTIMFCLKIMITEISVVVKAVTQAIKFILALVKGDWAGAWDAAKGFLQVFADAAQKIWNDIITYAGDLIDDWRLVINGFLTALVGTITYVVNSIVDLINDALLSILNGLATAINKFPGMSLPTELHLDHVEWSAPQIPALAQGTVIPPSMSEFIARLGDNNTETEVVSPLSTMKEAMLEALQESGFIGGSGGDINITLEVDGRTLARTLVKQNEISKKSRGVGLFA